VINRRKYIIVLSNEIVKFGSVGKEQKSVTSSANDIKNGQQKQSSNIKWLVISHKVFGVGINDQIWKLNRTRILFNSIDFLMQCLSFELYLCVTPFSK